MSAQSRLPTCTPSNCHRSGASPGSARTTTVSKLPIFPEVGSPFATPKIPTDPHFASQLKSGTRSA